MTDLTNTTENAGNFATPSRKFSEAIKICLRKYFDFSGRASRSEFWWFVLFIALCVVAVMLLGLIVFWDFFNGNLVVLLGIAVGLMILPFWVPLLTVGARRLHDTGRSESRLLMLVPFNIILFVFISGYGAMVGLLGSLVLMGAGHAWLNYDSITDVKIFGGMVVFNTFGGMIVVSVAGVVCLPILMYWWAQPGSRQPNQYDPSKQATRPQVVTVMLMGLPLTMVAFYIIGFIVFVLGTLYSSLV